MDGGQCGGIVNIIADIWMVDPSLPTRARRGRACGLDRKTRCGLMVCIGVRVMQALPEVSCQAGLTPTRQKCRRRNCHDFTVEYRLPAFRHEAEISAAITFPIVASRGLYHGVMRPGDVDTPNARNTWKLEAAAARSKRSFEGFQ